MGGEVYAVFVLQVDIYEDDIRIEALDQPKGLCSAVGFAHHLELGIAFNGILECQPGGPHVIHYQYFSHV
jgi:hypothetical protein